MASNHTDTKYEDRRECSSCPQIELLNLKADDIKSESALWHQLTDNNVKDQIKGIRAWVIALIALISANIYLTFDTNNSINKVANKSMRDAQIALEVAYTTQKIVDTFDGRLRVLESTMLERTNK